MTASLSIFITRLRPCSSTEICDNTSKMFSVSSNSLRHVQLLFKPLGRNLSPLAVVDEGPAAGDSADGAVLELQLQFPLMHCEDNPGAVEVASCEEDHPLTIEGAEVKLCRETDESREKKNGKKWNMVEAKKQEIIHPKKGGTDKMQKVEFFLYSAEQ